MQHWKEKKQSAFRLNTYLMKLKAKHLTCFLIFRDHGVLAEKVCNFISPDLGQQKAASTIAKAAFYAIRF